MALNHDGVLCARDIHAPFPEFGLHGGDAVAFLDAQAPGIADDGSPGNEGSQHTQGRPQVRTWPQVHIQGFQTGHRVADDQRVILPALIHPCLTQDVFDDLVSLQRVRVESFQDHGSFQGPQDGGKRRLGPVAFHLHVPGQV